MTWDYLIKKTRGMHTGIAKKTPVVAKIKMPDGSIKEYPIEFKNDENGRPYFEGVEN